MNIAFVFADNRREVNCSIWRMLWPAKAIRRAGHGSVFCYWQKWIKREPLVFSNGAEADVIVYERILTDEVAEDMRYWQSYGKKIAFDFDDAYDLMPPQLVAWKQWHQGTEEMPALLPLLRKNLCIPDIVHMPSSLLADDWAPYGQTTVIPNYPDLTNPNWARPYPVKIRSQLGWGGGATHTESFMRSGILPAIQQERMLLFGGNQDIWSAVPNARRYGYMHHDAWPYYAGMIGIGLAPLAGRYDDHRSWIKVLEYALKGIPWIATDAPPYRGCKGGILVDNKPKRWKGAINALRNESELYEELSQEGLEWAWKLGIDDHIQERIELYGRI